MSNYFITSDKINKLERALENATPESVQPILDDFHHQSRNSQMPFSLEPHLDTINSSFGAESVSDCIDRLPSTNFGLNSRSILEQMSPLAMKTAMRHIRNPYQSLFDCLTMDYRLSLRMLSAPEFIEGVTALLIDKNRKPNWRPSKLDQISDQQIEQLFQKLPPSIGEFEPLNSTDVSRSEPVKISL